MSDSVRVNASASASSNENKSEKRMSTPMSTQEARDRIFHVLDIYPAISPSMMNIAMNSVDSKIWKPVLEELLAADEVKSKTIYALTPIGRNQSYMVYYHPRFDYLGYYQRSLKAEADPDGSDVETAA